MSTGTTLPETVTPTGSAFVPGPTVPLPDLYEVVGTQIVEKPPMGAHEATLASFLFEFLAPFARQNQLGQMALETLFDLRPTVDRERRPDLAFVSVQKWPINRRAPWKSSWAVIPDLAVEIVSPTNLADDVLGKTLEYLQAGVRSIWVIYPARREIHVYDATALDFVRRFVMGQVLDGGDLLPGFQLPLQALFEDEAPDQ